MVTFEGKGDFKKTNTLLERMLEVGKLGILNKYGQKGIDALSKSTPKDTGLAANSWDYVIEHDKDHASITWLNKDIEGGCNVAILIQYGHGTRNGGYVKGRDFINPAMQPLFDEMADSVWKEVSNV